MRAGLDAVREDGEAFARRLEIARQRHDARHRVGAVEGEALAAQELERQDGASVGRWRDIADPHPPRAHQNRAGIELALPALESVIARLADHGDMRREAELHRPPAGLRQQQRRMPPQRRGNRVRPAAASPDRARSPCPSASRMPPGTAASRHCAAPASAARRCRPAGSARAGAAHSASTASRVSGQSYIGRAAMNSLMPSFRQSGRQRQAPSDYSFGGSAGTGAAPRPAGRAAVHLRAEGAARIGRAPQHRMHDRLLGLEGIVPEQREIARKDIAVVHRDPLVAALAKQPRQPVPGDRRALVVHEVQIVVEEQQRQRRALDDDGAPVRPLRPLVLGKGAHRDQRLAEPDRPST